MNTHFRVLCDFDGTIALDDVTDALLAAFADPEWETVEEAWKAGRIGSGECMRQQVSLLRAGLDDVNALLDRLPIDPTFPAFVRLCQGRGIDVEVVSDGLDHAINRILVREGLSLEVRANRLVHSAAGGWALEFPHAADTCRVQAANCKCAAASGGRDTLTVLVGDGRSDICLAERVDFVFAKSFGGMPSTLLEHCRTHSIPHRAFESFAEVAEGLTELGAFRDAA
ncbi:MtnX-like HAD-IB family phosphatase [Microvirga puerhi]|uniref:MtnX-like HAD-IB family phosphatase n=1 Tax=Microvirga puerhi TaxID=2876078 RepID=A0ABS7VTG6_9HYPH|nr:MtnX-like HAD-IB family phosphatase [Microvirga puerhi]MBZ6078861.1 MtnX-like HAD-IB family phosphatase [Microvirga puerhi]